MTATSATTTLHIHADDEVGCPVFDLSADVGLGTQVSQDFDVITHAAEHPSHGDGYNNDIGKCAMDIGD